MKKFLKKLTTVMAMGAVSSALLSTVATVSAAAIITFMSAWNNYLWPLVALQSNEMKTVPLLLSNLGSSYAPDFGLMMTAILIATIPTLIIFFVLQKYFVAGMLGAVK